MPVEQLIRRLAEGISRFLDAPARWEPPPVAEDETAAIARIRAEVYAALHSFAMERILEQHLGEWAEAFAFAGRGSFVRPG